MLKNVILALLVVALIIKFHAHGTGAPTKRGARRSAARAAAWRHDNGLGPQPGSDCRS